MTTEAVSVQRAFSIGCSVLLVLLAGAVPALAHEPIFSVGPRTIWRDGLGFEIELEREHAGPEEVWALHYEGLYGITEDHAFTIEVPQVLDRQEPGGSSAGLGDVLLRYKWRFFRRDVRGGAYQAALVGGVELPSGESAGPLPTGSGTYDLLVGATVGWEGRRWLLFGNGRYKRNGINDAGVDIGDTLLADVAVGFRPVRTAYMEPDTVIMAEINLESHDPWRRAGARLPNTGGELVFASFGAWITYRNHALKPGVQVPIHTALEGAQEKPDWKAVLAYEMHFSSFFGR